MKLPNWFKIIWWALLLIATSYILFMRLEDIKSGSSLVFDVFIFLIWVALMLVPIFNEIKFFGMELKQEIEDLKRTVISQITDFKSEMTNKINVSPTINLIPTNDSKIPELEERYRNKLDELLKTLGKDKLGEEEIKDVPEINKYLFSVRYKIEKELRRIWENTIGNPELRRKTSVLKILSELYENNHIDSNLYGPLREIAAIANYGIHGETLTNNQINFVKDIAPRLIASLQEIK